MQAGVHWREGQWKSSNGRANRLTGRWDYGYQTTAMADRTVVVDNNTWNNTHIATVGRAMASPERRAWEIYRSLDVSYVFVVFGGYIGCVDWPTMLGKVLAWRYLSHKTMVWWNIVQPWAEIMLMLRLQALKLSTLSATDLSIWPEHGPEFLQGG